MVLVSTPRGMRRSDPPTPEPVEWDHLEPELLRAWGRPGGRPDPEHFSIYGPSGSGKSTLQLRLLARRAAARGSHVVVVATKKADGTLAKAGWPVISEWPPDYRDTCVIFWARGGLSDEQQEKQRQRVHRLMNVLFVPESNKVIAWDELPYICSDLKLRRQITTIYREGRGAGLTNVAVMQRPTDVSRYVHSEVAWVAAFRPEDEDDRDRVAEVFGNRRFYREVLADLDPAKHEFLIRHKLTGEVYRSSLPDPRKHPAVPPQRRR